VTVAGAVPDDPLVLKGVDVFIPLKVPRDALGHADHAFNVIGRLRDSVTLAQAESELQVIAANIARDFPGTNQGWSVSTAPAFNWIVPDDLRRGLTILLAAVGMVLLIACANISNLLLTRAASRRHEIAVRKALGASIGALLRQLLAESLVLALAGGAAGLLAALWGVALLRGLLPADWPRAAAIAINPPVLLFSLAATLATGFLFGIAPAWHAARSDAAGALRASTRAGGTQGRSVRRLLVAGQLAMATLLVTGAALFLSTTQLPSPVTHRIHFSASCPHVRRCIL
jgi:putative ABC transport system permease protein